MVLTLLKFVDMINMKQSYLEDVVNIGDIFMVLLMTVVAIHAAMGGLFVVMVVGMYPVTEFIMKYMIRKNESS